jgi:hypothetical protein
MTRVLSNDNDKTFNCFFNGKTSLNYDSKEIFSYFFPFPFKSELGKPGWDQ